jgi:DNA-binding MarR family transcriptional regulator
MSDKPLLERLDPVLEHRVRLATCVLLSRTEEISFSRFKELLQQTDGNLGAHLRKLEDEAYIELRREFSDRRPVTWYRLTPAGRRALKRHLAGLESIIGVTVNSLNN